MDRTETARCIAKIQAYLACGQFTKAQEWADKLLRLMREAGLNTNV